MSLDVKTRVSSCVSCVSALHAEHDTRRDIFLSSCKRHVSRGSVVQCECGVVCCSVLRRVAVCCSVLQCIAVCCSVLQCVAVCCSVLQRAACAH